MSLKIPTGYVVVEYGIKIHTGDLAVDYGDVDL